MLVVETHFRTTVYRDLVHFVCIFNVLGRKMTSFITIVVSLILSIFKYFKLMQYPGK